MQAVALGTGAGSKIFYTIDRIPPIDTDNTGGLTLSQDQLRGEIRLKNVDFTYPSRPNVKILTDFSLDIAPGSTVALVGQSGSGKSTIIQLLERFYDAQSGVIELDGHAITDLNLLWLRRQIGYVSQVGIL